MSSSASQRVSTLLSHLSPATPSTPFSYSFINPAPTSFSKKPVRVVVTGAAGNIAYSILFMIGAGEMLGPDQPIELRLLDIPQMAGAIKGVIMELQDCAYPVLASVTGTTDYKAAFENVDYALLVGAKPRGPGMQRKDLLSANGAIFAGQGKALNQYASRNVKVVVVGNPANTNALIAATNAPDLPKSAFTAMTRLDQNRAISQISGKLNGTPVTDIKNIIIWGNHSKTQVPDVNHATVKGKSIRSAVKDEKWLDGEFVSTVQDRGAAIIAARQKSSAASAASACVDHVRDWARGTPAGEYVSMGVYSDGKSYGIPAGLVFSFPCTCKNGKWEIVQGLKIDERTKKLIDLTTKELQEEKSDALSA